MNHALNVVRSVIYVAWLSVTVIPFALATIVVRLFTRGAAVYAVCNSWLKLSIWGARVICGVRYRIQGMEHLPTAADEKAAVILCPKHQSTWEALAFPTIMPHPLCYVFKRELLYIPFFGWAIGSMDMIHIDRSRRSQAWRSVVEQGLALMKQGNWVIMFPEGTRIARGEQGDYKNGASRLAITAGVPVVPIAVTSAKCWPRKSFVLRPGMIDIVIGKPIPSTGRGAEELMKEVEHWIETQMRLLDPAAYPAPARAEANVHAEAAAGGP